MRSSTQGFLWVFSCFSFLPTSHLYFLKIHVHFMSSRHRGLGLLLSHLCCSLRESPWVVYLQLSNIIWFCAALQIVILLLRFPVWNLADDGLWLKCPRVFSPTDERRLFIPERLSFCAPFIVFFFFLSLLKWTVGASENYFTENSWITQELWTPGKKTKNPALLSIFMYLDNIRISRKAQSELKTPHGTSS